VTSFKAMFIAHQSNSTEPNSLQS